MTPSVESEMLAKLDRNLKQEPNRRKPKEFIHIVVHYIARARKESIGCCQKPASNGIATICICNIVVDQ